MKEDFDLDYYGGPFKEKPKNNFKKWIISIIFLVLIIGFIFWFVDLIKKVNFQSSKKSIENVLKDKDNSDNAIQNYDWFRKQYIEYLTLQNKISESDSTLIKFKSKLSKDSTKWNYENKSELLRLQIISDRLRFKKEEIIILYNKNSKECNRSLFDIDELPNELKK